MSSGYDTLVQAARNKAVVEIIDKSTLKVQTYGNCTLFNGIANGDLELGNVTTLTGGSYLKVNVCEPKQ